MQLLQLSPPAVAGEGAVMGLAGAAPLARLPRTRVTCLASRPATCPATRPACPRLLPVVLDVVDDGVGGAVSSLRALQRSWKQNN